MTLLTYEAMDFVWISSYWDGPLEGLCRVDGRLMLFREAGKEDTYRVLPLSPTRKALWLLRKRLFEICVGEHWSYPQRRKGVYFRWRRPVFLHKFLFWAYYGFQPALIKLTAFSPSPAKESEKV